MTIKTRSQTKEEKSAIYEVNIDFDEASKAWQSNKKSIGNGSYKYLCLKKNTKNTKNTNCLNKCLPCVDYCKSHLSMTNN
jgi:hypothetical protein